MTNLRPASYSKAPLQYLSIKHGNIGKNLAKTIVLALFLVWLGLFGNGSNDLSGATIEFPSRSKRF